MLKKIKNKYILIDTNILIYSSRSPNEFKPFFNKIRKYKISPAIDYSIKLEFLRSSNTLKAFNYKKDYLDLFFGDKKNHMIIPTEKKIFENAMQLSILYNFLNVPKRTKISPIDCLIAGQLMKYKEKLALATINNSDFPLEIFNRLEIFNIELSHDILNIGIYQFSGIKYQKAYNKVSYQCQT
ncbi:hypothetical protein KJ912_03855 [Patescibacteria group bacterium]|nr:hypothetical protein [Patescibacteria group bacterium]